MIHGLRLLLAGVTLYAAISHLLMGYQRPPNRLHLLFSAFCFASSVFSLFVGETLLAQTGPELLAANRISLAIAAINFLCLFWFFAEYTRFRPLRFLYTVTTLLLLTLVANFVLPYSLQFAEMPTVVHKVFWGTRFSFPAAQTSPWFLLAALLLLSFYAFAAFALLRAYRNQQGRLIIPMLAALALSLATTTQGMLVRSGWIEAMPLGYLSFPALVIVMSMVLRVEMNQRVARMSAILEHVPASVYLKDLEGRYVLTNSRFETLHGRAGKRSIGKTVHDIASVDRASIWSQHDQVVIASGTPLESEFTEEINGQVRTFRTVKFPLLDDQGAPYAVGGISTDITHSLQADERILHLAHFDQLTGLANRVTLEARFSTAMAQVQQHQQGLAVMYLDLDHFKYVNDTVGHTLGDQLLVAVARRMQAMLRPQDLLARLGGDDFVFLLPDMDAAACARLAEHLQIELSAPYRIEEREISITASIGVALYPDDGADLETLSRNADTAMYKVKQDARNGVLFYHPSMQTATALVLRLTNDLKLALQRNQLSLHYQPQMDLHDGRLIGAEALLRWNHPELGMISPAQFIPIAESSGLIIPIGEWVLRTAASQARAWLDSGLPALLMAVNLSAVQFRHARLIETVVGILAQTGLPASALELELTEAVAMDDPLGAMAVMDALHQHGVQMSIDDFGTGYSSLSYLKRFKVSKLKIDQSFVRDIDSDPDDQAIVSAIISMARSLGMHTIAEGVETEAQRSFLRANGCAQAQGYLFSRPVPPAVFESFAREQAASL